MLHHALRASDSSLASVALETSATSSLATIAWPTVQDGDVAVLFDGARDGGSSSIPADVTPADFTQVNTIGHMPSTNGYRTSIAYKICDGSETGDITGLDGNSLERKALLIFRGNVPITGVTVQDTDAVAAAADPAAQTITSGSGAVPLVALSLHWQYTSVQGQSMTANTGSVASGTYLTARYKIYDASPANVTVDQSMGTAAQNHLHSCYLEFS